MPNLPSVGRAMEIECPICHAEREKPCKDETGSYRAPHVERGRIARWARMGFTP